MFNLEKKKKKSDPTYTDPYLDHLLLRVFLILLVSFSPGVVLGEIYTPLDI